MQRGGRGAPVSVRQMQSAAREWRRIAASASLADWRESQRYSAALTETPFDVAAGEKSSTRSPSTTLPLETQRVRL